MRSPLFADLSNNNSTFDANAYRQSGHIIIALKASEGLGFVDPRHHAWVKTAHAHGIAVIHYHFGRPDSHPGGTGGAEEAQALLHATEGFRGPHDYLVYDGERAQNGSFGLQVDHCRGFDVAIQHESRFATILYASASELAKAEGALVGGRRRDWDANYSTAPNTHAPHHELIARQFTDGMVGPGPHALPGVGQCDVNVMHGSLLQDVLRNA